MGKENELLNEEKSFIKKVGFGNLLTIIFFLGSSISISGVALYRLSDVQEKVEKLTNERDGMIVIQTQQKEINQRLDKLDEKQDKIFELVYTISNKH